MINAWRLFLLPIFLLSSVREDILYILIKNIQNWPSKKIIPFNFNPKLEFIIVTFIHYKLRIAIVIFDL